MRNGEEKNILLENVNSDIVYPDKTIQKKEKFFRLSVMAMPLGAVILGIFYITNLNIIIFWHPILSSLSKIVYFPFFIFSEKVFYIEGSIINIPNPLTIGMAALFPLLLLYIFSRLVIYIGEKFNLRRIFLISNISLFVVLMISASFFSSFEKNRCISDKESNLTWADHKSLVEFNLENMSINEFKRVKKWMELFYILNGVEYIYDDEGSKNITVKTETGKEIEMSCRLESYPSVFFAKPTSVAVYFGTKAWEEKRDVLCGSEGFAPEDINECTRFILKDTAVGRNLNLNNYDYKASENNKIINKLISNRKSILRSTGKYSDDYISFGIDKEKFEFLNGEPSKTGLTTEHIDSEKYAYLYNIRKVSGYEKMNGITFEEPMMGVYIPNSSDPSFKGMYQGMWPQVQVINESKIKLGNYEYLRKTLSGGNGFEQAIYDTQIEGRKVRITLISRPYFEKYPDLQKEFEEIIASMEFKFVGDL